LTVINAYFFTVAPHYFQPIDLEKLGAGDKKMPIPDKALIVTHTSK
jgi:hypothetical protein